MKKMISILIVLFLVTTGCSLASKEIKNKSESARTDVFSEVRSGETMQPGFVELQLKASIKTPLEHYYLLESRKSPDGKAGYTFVINIDGQAATWTVVGLKDSTTKYDENGKTSLNPEAGDGMKYTLEKMVRLSAGNHNIFFGLPGNNFYKELEITLEDGKTHILEFKPIYRLEMSGIRIRSFIHGIHQYDVFLNGSSVPSR
jgi:hypothetical protein